MSTYRHGQYFPILIESIKAGVAHPFGCHLHLKTNNRIILFVGPSESFPEEKLKKLREHQVGKLYVSEADRKTYHDFLRTFLDTPEGKQIIQKVRDNPDLPESKNLAIPEEMAKELGLPIQIAEQSITDTGDPPKPETPPAPTPTPTTAKEPSPQAVVSAEIAKPEPPPEVVQPEPISENKVIQLLRASANELDAKLKVRSSLTEEDRKVIRNSTDRISKELQKATGATDEDPSKVSQIVKGCRDGINSEIIKIRGIAERLEDPAQKDVLESMLKGLDSQLKELDQVDATSQSAGEASKKVKGTTAKIEEEIWKVKSLVTPDDKEVESTLVSESVLSVVSQVEKLLGIKLRIAAENEPNGQQAQAMQEVHQSLSEQYISTAQTAQKFSGFVSQIQNRITSQEAAVAQEFELFLKGLGQSQEQAQKTVENILVSQGQTAATVTAANMDNKTPVQAAATLTTLSQTAPSTAADQATVGGSGEQPQSKDTVQSQTPPSPQGQNQAEVQSSPASAEDASELQVLKSQLEDAQSLLKKYRQKIEELQSVMEKSGEYSQALEKEVDESKKQNTLLNQKLDQSEMAVSRLTGTQTDSEKAIARRDEEIKIKDERLAEIRTQLESVQKEAASLRGNFVDEKVESGMVDTDPEKLPFPGKAIALVREKDAIINQLMKKLEAKQQESVALKKEILTVTGNLQNATQLKKEMGSRVDKLMNEHELMKQNEVSVNRKAQLSANLLEKARKTISSLTTMTEELKKERVEYMTKTNEAMKDFKEVMSKTKTLSNHVQAEVQRNQKIAQQYETLQRKQKELLEKTAQAEKKANQYEVEIKQLKKEIQNQTGQADTRLLEEANQKIEKLREENRQITTQFAGEQRKVAELNRSLKEMKLKQERGQAA